MTHGLTMVALSGTGGLVVSSRERASTDLVHYVSIMLGLAGVEGPQVQTREQVKGRVLSVSVLNHLHWLGARAAGGVYSQRIWNV